VCFHPDRVLRTGWIETYDAFRKEKTLYD
jgi:hypothetical protein